MERNVVKLFTAQDNIQAEMILAALKDAQIPAYKTDLGAAGIMNIYSSNSTFGEDIFVAKENSSRAMEVLEGMGLGE